MVQAKPFDVSFDEYIQNENEIAKSSVEELEDENENLILMIFQ